MGGGDPFSLGVRLHEKQRDHENPFVFNPENKGPPRMASRRVCSRAVSERAARVESHGDCASAFIQDTDQDWLGKFQRYRLNERQLKALVHIKHTNVGINNSEYRELNNLTKVGDDRKANFELVKMVKLGILKKIGSNRDRRYLFKE